MNAYQIGQLASLLVDQGWDVVPTRTRFGIIATHFDDMNDCKLHLSVTEERIYMCAAEGVICLPINSPVVLRALQTMLGMLL